ncbi:PTS sugar transporter subunit IIA [Caproiciproducens sp. CPB-2]|uniref:PTS sugar transporter subunit IIA n=1 Tax=Caproiciproducens sp. CPB-2 TaxID=3030017 RepID=UPI0023D9D921|nr:PTS sugar transporter subunit IIA [Caproiciproducens sp. CPB-2]MDF1494815.1 PTS sugar transporter subunit IIA [Caproiciproducens sp. CPB-2]
MEALIQENLIYFDVDVKNKVEAIEFLASKMYAAGRIKNEEAYVSAVLEREKEFSTGVGFSVATPHAKTDNVKTATVAFAHLKNEIQWDEEEKASLIFLLAIPDKDRGDRHLQILASISRKLVHEEFRELIAKAKTPKEILKLIGEV